MAKEKKEKQSEIARLMPNSIVVRVNDEDIRVPTNACEAAIQNILLVSQFRQTLQNALKHYKDKEMIPTPRELRDMAGAIRDCNEASDAVFAKVELPMNETSKQKKEEEVPIDFTKIIDINPNSGGFDANGVSVPSTPVKTS